MNLDKLRDLSLIIEDNEQSNGSQAKSSDIAIIGLDAKISNASNIHDFWEALSNERDLIRDFPEQRYDDANRLCLLKTNTALGKVTQYGYLEQIDQFDPSIFGISNAEAELMGPSQRLFLESAWKALEDAGYCAQKLKDKKTGVYIGCNYIADQYCAIEKEKNSSNYGMAVSGNVNSIVASRISYFLDLKGPAVVIDTACSSSLVAVYFACQQLRSGDASMAIAGGIRLTTIPPHESTSQFGVESASGRTTTFDEQADGTGGGEGVVSVILKPLQEALLDHDHIYAVIKGGSINQDGTSLGITAPNAAAQAEVIKSAWKDAQIDPMTISYIEAHGTATNLGDPIEISGIETAFCQFTDRRQFCAIGSVKSNIGHLDSASGAAGLLKAVLMLKNRMIPPTLHFNTPNKKINFIESPVYICDTLKKWDSKYPRRCGVSSFGISGTNCHMILEEAPQMQSTEKEDDGRPILLAVSAKKKSQLIEYVKKHQNYLKENKNINFRDFCYTAVTGRNHYQHRFILIANSKKEFLNMTVNDDAEFDIGEYGSFKVIDIYDSSREGYISIKEKNRITQKANLLAEKADGIHDDEEYVSTLKEITKLYIAGADVDFSILYSNRDFNTISIPTYPYNHKRFWVDIENMPVAENQIDKPYKRLHPLVDSLLVDTYNQQIYSKVLSIDKCDDLKAHKLNNEYVLPGTAFIEMARYVSSQILKTDYFEIRDLLFLTPLSCSASEERNVHIIANIREDYIDIKIYSKSTYESDWICHVEQKAFVCEKKEIKSINIRSIVKQKEEVVSKSQINELSIVSVSGERWHNVSKLFMDDEGIVVKLNANAIIKQEKKDYFLFTPMLDSAINAGIYIVDGQYLPFSFEKARFYKELPDKYYSYLKQNTSAESENQFASFDIVLCTLAGEVIGELENYVIRKVNNPGDFMTGLNSHRNIFSKIEWIEHEMVKSKRIDRIIENETIVVIKENGEQLGFADNFKKYNLVHVELSNAYEKISSNKYKIRNSESDFERAMKEIKELRPSIILQCSAFGRTEIATLDDIVQATDIVLQSTFNLVKAMIKADYRDNIRLILLTLNGTSVDGNEEGINPMHNSLIGMGACIESEYTNFQTKAIDLDNKEIAEILQKELLYDEEMYCVAYRRNIRYTNKLTKVKYSEKTNQLKLDLSSKGVYVIAGGLGGMGISFASHLAKINPDCNIVLINRTYSQKEFRALEKGSNERLNKKIEALQNMWEKGYSIEIVKSDITDRNKIQKAFDELADKYQVIKGIVNAAGIAGDGFIFNKEWRTFKNVLAPKVQGTWNLHELTDNMELDFFVVCSSIISIFGAPGQSDYTAANAFLDCFSSYRRKEGKKSLTINWTGWSESGMAADHNISGEDSFTKFVSDKDGAAAFEYAIKSDLDRLTIGKFDEHIIRKELSKFESKAKLFDEIVNVHAEEAKKMKDCNEISDITIYGISEDKLTDIHKYVINAWAETLNTNEVDVYEKFFVAGGNSLLAVNLQKNINLRYPDIITVTDVFTYSTVLELSDYIKSKVETKENNKGNDYAEKDVDKLMEQFANSEISIESLFDKL